MASYIARRKFLATLGGAAVGWPLTARAQQPGKIPRIGIIDDSLHWNAFRHGLRDLGYLEGQNIAFDYAYGDGAPERLAEAAAALVRRPVDVIATFGTPASFAAKQATTTIPIVMISIGDPVRAGLVPSLARPGGNITGNTILGPDVGAKRLQILKEVIPTVSRVAFLFNPDNASNVLQLEEIQAAAPTLGVTVIPVSVSPRVEFETAFAAMVKERPDAFAVTGEPFHQIRIAWIMDFMAKNRLPVVYQIERERACRGIDVLRRERVRLVPARSRLRTQNFARHQARRATGGAASQIRAGRQPQDRQGAWARADADVHRACRRGDRMTAKMKRRAFITLVGGATAWSLVARAQQPGKLPTIGFLGATTPLAEGQRLAAFVQRLRQLGWMEGRNVSMEVRWAEGRSERYAEIAAEFVRLKVDLIVTYATPPVLAAKQATSIIPIIFASAADPAGTGLVASLARPGGNVTGLSNQQADTATKRLELVREVIPGLGRLAILANVGNPAAVLDMREVQAAARTLSLNAVAFEIRRAEDIAPAFEALIGRVHALYVAGDPLVNTNRIRINSLALGARLPTMHGYREYVEAGGLMSYGPNVPDQYRRAADFADKILRGTKPSDIPVEQPTKFDLVINLTTAKALGLTVPPTLLARADEVIE